VGSNRHRQWINGLSVAIALNLTVGALVIAARRDDRPRPERAAGVIEAPSPLSAGKFSNRRSGETAPSTGAPAAPSTSTAAAAAPSTSTTALRPTSTSVTVPKVVTSTTRRERVRSSTTTTTAVAVPAPAVAAGAPAGRRDAVGDTFNAETDAAVAEPKADIVEYGAVRSGNNITFTMQVSRPTDPRTDDKWGGNSTFALWSVDTNGDSAADYEVHYFQIGKDEETDIGGYVSKPGDDNPPLCAIAPSFGPDGYGAVVDAACLGNPASLTYQALMSYDTNPGDDAAPIANDVAPDTGWTPAIKR
jgi:hypothetical protein